MGIKHLVAAVIFSGTGPSIEQLLEDGYEFKSVWLLTQPTNGAYGYMLVKPKTALDRSKIALCYTNCRGETIRCYEVK
jgi:hypothetical protein